MNPKLKKIIELQEELDIRKKIYDEIDRLTLELLSEGFDNQIVDGVLYQLKDNFHEKNTVFRVAGVKRYEITAKKLKGEV